MIKFYLKFLIFLFKVDFGSCFFFGDFFVVVVGIGIFSMLVYVLREVFCVVCWLVDFIGFLFLVFLFLSYRNLLVGDGERDVLDLDSEDLDFVIILVVENDLILFCFFLVEDCMFYLLFFL